MNRESKKIAQLSVAVLTVAGALLACKSGGDSTACPARYKLLPNQAAPTSCSCTAEQNKGSVWGTDTYTTDSSICAAAVHAGAITSGGSGTVTVKPSAGCPSYQGSARNGVTTGKWGKYSNSFYFDGKGTGVCGSAAAAPAGDACPSKFKTAGSGLDTSVTCSCPATTPSGGLWGSKVYTEDSSVCRAAVHSGALAPNTAGKVTAKAFKGCPSYSGSEKNGIKSGKWGKYGRSFHFPSQGAAACD